jgi:putative membrane protein
MNTMKWMGVGACLLMGVASACNGDDDDNDGAGAGGTAHGGTAGKAGHGGASGRAGASGRGGFAGTAGTISAAGRAGSSGNAGRAGNFTGGTSGLGGEGGDNVGGQSGGGAGGEGGLGEVGMLSDSEILQVAVTANEGEAAEGKEAVKRAQAEVVHDFAQEMVNDHTAAAAAATSLGDTSGLGLSPSAASRALDAQAEAALSALDAATDEEFDRVYMESQVAAHEEVLGLLDDTLIVQAKNSDLRELLMSMKDTVQMHLSEARDIEQGL